MNKISEKREQELRKMFPHIAGCNEIREEAAQIVDFFENKEIYKKRGAHFPNGFLFYGVPGTGKSRLVMDIASYLNIPLIEISASDAVEKKITLEADILDGFKKAHEAECAIVFIDEIEKFAGFNKFWYDVTENLANQKILLHELDKIRNKEGIVIIATCNDTKILGDAMLRSGRFDRQVSFSLPNSVDRKAILEHFLKDQTLEKGFSIDDIVKMTGSFTGADLECLANEAIIHSVSLKRDVVALEDVSYAIGRVSLKDLPRENNLSKESLKLLAYHEAGHAYMINYFDSSNLGGISLLRQGKSQGRTKVLDKGNEEIKTKKELEKDIMIGVAGFLGCEIMSGEQTTGNTSDWGTVINAARTMLNEGFYGPIYIPIDREEYSMGPFDPTNMTLRQQRCSEIIENLMIKTREILNKGKDDIEKLSSELVLKITLTSKEVNKILNEKTN